MTIYYCCYGMFADVGHSPDCKHYHEPAMTNPTPQTPHGIAGEQFTNSERGMLRKVANTLMRRAQKNGQTHQLADVLIGLSNTVPSLPSLAELERDAGRWNYALRHPECLKQENGDYYGTAWWEGLVDAARAKEAKPSDKCSWCGGPSPCNCTDEDCAP